MNEKNKKLVICRDVEFIEDEFDIGNNFEKSDNTNKPLNKITFIEKVGDSDKNFANEEIQNYNNDDTENCNNEEIEICNNENNEICNNENIQNCNNQNFEICNNDNEDHMVTQDVSNQIDPNEGTISRIDSDIEYEPKCYSEALRCKFRRNWKESMQEELNEMKNHNVWTIIERPNDKNIIGCRWVYKIKFEPFTRNRRFRARLVAKGYNQIYGHDYENVFAPVCKQPTLRLFLTMCVTLNIQINHCDIKTAFLNGKLN